jgi:5-methylcytosine-specific restriction endonuclease McrA
VPASYGDEHLSELVLLCSSCHKHVLERLLKRKEFDIKGFLRRLEDVYDRTKKRGQ